MTRNMQAGPTPARFGLNLCVGHQALGSGPASILGLRHPSSLCLLLQKQVPPFPLPLSSSDCFHNIAAPGHS